MDDYNGLTSTTDHGIKTPMFLTSDAIEKQLSRQSATIRKVLLEMLNSLQTSCLSGH
jgi:hypothetical protein